MKLPKLQKGQLYLIYLYICIICIYISVYLYIMLILKTNWKPDKEFAKTDLFSESDCIKHRKLLDHPTGLIPSHWRPSYVRQLVDQLVWEPYMSPEKSASQSPAEISRIAQPTPDSFPLENTLCGVGGRAEWGDLLQGTLLPVKANLTQRRPGIVPLLRRSRSQHTALLTKQSSPTVGAALTKHPELTPNL